MSRSEEKQRQTEKTSTKTSLLWPLCAFLFGLAIMSAYTSITIKSQVKAVLESNEEIVSKHLYKRAVDEDGESQVRVKRQAFGDSGFAAAHLTGDTSGNSRSRLFQTPLRGDYFRWNDGLDNSFSLLEIVQDDRGTMVVINKSGYYLVYSQVTYNSHGKMLIGHETVRISQQVEYSLMTSLSTQQLATARSGVLTPGGKSIDSGYHAGIFYLHAGDRVAVKPTSYASTFSYTMGTKGSFFGVSFVHY